MTTISNDNPLLQPFTALHETAPFDRLLPEHFLEAIQEAYGLPKLKSSKSNRWSMLISRILSWRWMLQDVV
ncbi:hypothetical protein [Nitritalea halalkaliphila]|uniref:hypothetical protein n=1 Tax=Nitritalea halalkaliphila TaxID=590849 RepID=UPI00293451FE|nr:hypothetical protein [Nitritalea halalkaliphila]